MRLAIAFRTLVALAGIQSVIVAASSTDASKSGRPTDIVAYLSEAFDHLRTRPWHSTWIDWDVQRAVAMEKASRAQTFGDAHRILHEALIPLNELDWHARIFLPDGKPVEPKRTGLSDPTTSPFASRRRPEGHVLANNGARIAHIVVPMTMGAPGPKIDAKAAAIDAVAAKLSSQKPCGWVVDLRGNQGGNMWPMILGLRAVLGHGLLGAAVDKNGKRSRWFLTDSVAGVREADGGETIYARLSTPVDAEMYEGAIAVLIDRGTASSGEATAVAMLGRPRVRSFGEPSAGATTSPDFVDLSDGAKLLVGLSVYQDRAGRLYPTGILPDVSVRRASADVTTSGDRTLAVASAWLATQAECSRRQ